MSSRLFLALALSLALHGGLLVPDILKRLSATPPPRALQASLRQPAKPEAPPPEPLLKNTLDDEPARVENTPPPPKPDPSPAQKKNTTLRRDTQIVQRALSKTQFYPTQAVERGIEGNVRLIIRLAPDGSVEDVGIAASSGHAILDNAAVRAAYAMPRQIGVASRELIIPVQFRLE